MTTFFLTLYDALSRRRRLTAALLLIVLSVCGMLVMRMHYKENIADFLPQNEQSRKYESVYAKLGGQNKIAVIFTQAGDSVPGDEAVDRIAPAMETFGRLWAEADTDSCVTDMQVRVDEERMMELLDFVRANYPYFLTEADYSRIDSLLSRPDYVAHCLEENKRLLMLPAGGFLSENLRYDPLRLFSPLLNKLQTFGLTERYRVADGYLFDKESGKGLVFFSSPYGISESGQNEKLAEMIESVARQTEAAHPEISVSAVGAPLIAVTNARQIKADSLLSVSLAVVLILGLLLFAFRRIGDLWWIAASTGFGWLFALACISLYKDSISMIVLGIGSVIIGIAVNYPLHFLDHLKHEPNKRTALKEMIPPLLIGNVTTVSAFLCLLFLDAEAMHDLGLFGSLTLVGTILFVLVFLPVLAAQRKAARTVYHFNLDRLVPFRLKKRKLFFLPLVVITAVLGYFSLNTSFDADMQHINYMTSRQRSDLSLLSSSLRQQDGTKRIYAVAEGETMEQALRNNEELMSKAAPANDGIGTFLPSQVEQRKRLERWERFRQEHAATLTAFREECRRQGFSENAFSPFLESTATRYETRDISHFGPFMQTIGKNFVQEQDGTIRIVNYVQIPAEEAASLKETLNGLSPGCFAFDAEDVSSQLVSILSDDFNFIGLMCGFVVFAFLWLSFGRVELGFLSFLPLAVSWIWILGLMQVFGVQFNIVNIILATFIFGQGDDYTIFITEGLMYEYAYGKKTLDSYKNSVALSALIMFIGIGTLILGKHPAMRSLAEVTIIGMATVVIMTYYLPPLVFDRLTRSGGEWRQVPVTLKRLTYSLFAFVFFLITMILVTPCVMVYFAIGKTTETKRLRYHRLLQGFATFVIRRVPGVRFSWSNPHGEMFDKPAMIICNHQSHLDLMCLMMLTPKLVILTNDWVWNNPFYGLLIRYAEFYPVSDGIDANLSRLQSLVDRGYSVVIFPEGTRSADCSILRFHRGAFYLAELLKLDVLPVFVHGAGHVLPKKDFMLREGQIYMEVQRRVPFGDTSMGNTFKEQTSAWHRYYIKRFDEIRRLREGVEYCIPYVRYKYMYKGSGVAFRCRKTLKALRAAAAQFEERPATVWILHSGQGEMAWIYALTHRDAQVYAFEKDEDLHLLASCCTGIPANLHFVRWTEETSFSAFPPAGECWVLSDKADLPPEVAHPKYFTVS